MDPIAVVLGILLGGGCLGGGLALGRRDADVLRAQLEQVDRSDSDALRGLKSEHKALMESVFNQGKSLTSLTGKVDGMAAQARGDHELLMRLAEAAGQTDTRAADAAEAVERINAALVQVNGQLEQLEGFAARAAAEVGELRQRLLTSPQPPAGFPVMAAQAATPEELIAQARTAQAEFMRRQQSQAPTAVAVASPWLVGGMPSMPERTPEEAAALNQAVLNAQAQLARQQRTAMAASFQQPAGGQ